MSLVGLDIGGTNLKAVSLAADGMVLASAVVSAGGAIPRDDLLAAVAATTREVAGGRPDRVGLAVGGAVQPDGTMRLGATNLPNLAGLTLADDLRGAPRRALPCRA